MKILLLSQWFQPEPFFKGLPFAQALVVRGHDVQVLTGFPNYPGGKLYPGYRIRPWQRETIEGIEVIRVPLFPSHDNSGVRRALNYFSFAFSAGTLGAALIRKPDVIYVYHPPLTTGLAAIAIGTLRRVPFVYDVQDLWPDTIAASGMMLNPFALMFLGRLCQMVYRRAAHVTVLSPGFKEKLKERGVPDRKLDVIYNWCDESVLQPPSLCSLHIRRPQRFTILFAGTMGIVQGLDTVLRVARICRTTVPSADFVFIGGGVERVRLEKDAARMGLDNVRFLPKQPMEAMAGILVQADALLVHLNDHPLFRITIPSKLQTYLAAGKPILMCCRGDAAHLVERSRSGIVCNPGDDESIAAAVKLLVQCSPEQLAEMGRSGRDFYMHEFSMETGVDGFERILSAVVRSRPASGLPNPVET